MSEESARRVKSPRPSAAGAWADHVRKRMKQARLAANLSQPEAAIALGVTLAAYQKYESRSALPSYLIPRACIAFRVPAWWLLTGQVGGEPHDTPLARDASQRPPQGPQDFFPAIRRQAKRQ